MTGAISSESAFNPAVSPSALKSMRSAIRSLKLRRQSQLSLGDIAERLNPLLRGWIGYYGRYTPSALHPLFRYVKLTLLGWAMRKYKRFATHKTRAARFIDKLATECADLFAHWRLIQHGSFA